MNKKIIKSTFILLIGGLITKVLALIIKIYLSRTIGSKILGSYMLIIPTFSLFIGLANLGMPTALAKLVAENKRRSKELFLSVIPVILLVNIILCGFIIIISKYLSFNLLHNPNTYYGILAIALVIPFTTISSILRSYFFGKEEMIPHVISNFIDDIVRLIIYIIFLPKVIKYGTKYIILFLISTNIITEASSIITLLLFLPKNSFIRVSDLKINKNYLKAALNIGIPNTTSRLIGSIAYFFEPIILTNVLLNVGYSNTYIREEYGIFSGYVIPLVLLPSFFSQSLANALLPNISKDYSLGKIKIIKKKITLAVILSFSIGLFFTILFVSKPLFFLHNIYHTTSGSNYLKLLAPICLIQYISYPISSVLDAIGLSKSNMYSNSLGVILRTVFLFILSYLKIGILGLIISISIDIVITTLYQIITLKKVLR